VLAVGHKIFFGSDKEADMNRTLLAVGLVALVALAGCSALTGGESPAVENGVDAADTSTGATNVTQSVGIEVDETTAGEELTAIGATYPREHFAVDSAQHDQISIGIDQDGDGEAERTFDEEDISGVNNNDFSFTVTLDSGYTLQNGDVVTVEYPDTDNPSESGEYVVEIQINDEQTTDASITIG